MDHPKTLTAERARELLRYDAETGNLYWRVSRGPRAKAGCEVGTVWKHPNSECLHYRLIMLDGRRYYAHRVVWMMTYGEFPSEGIDHINGDGLDNRLSNLRAASSMDNLRNAARSRNNTSGVTGIHWNKSQGEWRAHIKVDGKMLHLGYFPDKDDAVDARKAAERKYGFHVNHGRSVTLS